MENQSLEVKTEKEENGTEDRGQEKDGCQEQYRIVINRESSEILEQLRLRVIDKFDAVAVTKSDIANWLISKSQQSFNDADVKALRELYFDDRKLLGSILKDAKEENNLPESLKRAVREHFGLSVTPKIRAQKPSKTA
jgi:hypothetical protein